MEQFMYTYLVQKYGLRSLIVQWATALINGVRTHTREDHEVALSIAPRGSWELRSRAEDEVASECHNRIVHSLTF